MVIQMPTLRPLVQRTGDRVQHLQKANLLIHPLMKASDVEKLMHGLGYKVVHRDSNVINLRIEQAARKAAQLVKSIAANDGPTEPEAA